MYTLFRPKRTAETLFLAEDDWDDPERRRDWLLGNCATFSDISQSTSLNLSPALDLRRNTVDFCPCKAVLVNVLEIANLGTVGLPSYTISFDRKIFSQ
mmetsp:Transcript_86027/g.157636  ORF Transcript_86027/g.157636 Transcript_86027/m.157636 type:complete len:98 (-) Transcript_86027:694-987(-)